MDTATEYALAYALTTTAGLRGFLALLAASLAAHFGLVHLSGSFAWLGSDGASIVLALLAVTEIAADKIPVVDNALHGLYFVIRPAAGAILAGGLLHPPSSGELIGLMVLGALNSFVVHGASATARVTSTATTLGAGNVALSAAEDIIAITGAVLSILAPWVAGIAALLLVIVLFMVAKRIARKHAAGA